MFTSSKITNSPRINSNSISSSMNETPNGIPKSFIQPKMTSTPLVRRESIFATPPKPRLLSPRRYSLSDIATPPRSSSKRDSTKIHATGPLLASTKYNVNVSTYEDTKSPGLAGRIVQYNEEAERERERQRPPTHQAKYGSPGLFPIVHLFKKKLPLLEQKPRRVMIRIASPEYSRQHSQEYNRKLLEGIIKPGSPTNSRIFTLPSGETNSSTRSVLDALKEISRKRIHANEVKTVIKRLLDEYEQNEDSGKRLRTEQFNGVDSAKRVRDESPLLETSASPTKPVFKRVCMYDEYAASCSSTDFSFKKSDQSGPKRKSTSISTLTENPKDSKQVKLINAETQTVTSETKEDAEENEEPREHIAEEQDQSDNQTSDDDEDLDEDDSSVRVFNDAPLERIRKNRLAALMGSLSGKDAILSPKPDFSDSLTSSDTSMAPEITISEMYKATDKPLISILSTPKKVSPNKSNKHVHFSIPESTSQTDITSTPVTSFSVTQSSTSIISPITSVSESKITFGSNRSEGKLETPAPPSSPVSLTPSSTSVTTAVPVIMFGTGSNSSSLASIVSKESSSASLAIEASKSDFTIPNVQLKNTASSTGLVVTTSSVTFGSGSPITTFSSPMAKPSSSMASPPKLGGFKFDLNKSASTTTTTAASIGPSFSFSTIPQTDINKSKAILGPSISNSDLKNAQPILGSAPANLPFGAKSTSSVSSVSNNNPSITSFSTGGPFAANTTPSSLAAQATSVVPSFKFGPNNVGSNPAALGGFGVATTNSPFGTANTTSSTPAFGTNTSTSTFGTSTTTPTFGSNTSTPSFAPNTSTPSFGANTSTPKLGENTPTPTFGTNTSTAPPATSVPAFGTSKPPAYPFGTSNTSSSFAVLTTTSASIAFGAPSTTTASASFAASATSPSSGFGVSSTSVPSTGFGSTTTPSTLGGFGAPPSSANTSFGSSAVPMFGANKPVSPFGATANVTPAFGTPSVSNSSPFGKSSASPFGQSTTQSGFGTPTTTTTTDSFGSASSFLGTTTTSSPMFGGSNSAVPGFGVKTGGFGTTSSNTNIFGAAANAPASGFGPITSKPAFGVATSSPFGNPTAATTVPSFGSNTTPTFSFGAKTTASSSFGSGNAFGTTTTTASTGFGTSTTPAFNASNSFGSTSSFGSSNAFGNSGTPAFGTAAATTTTQSGSFGTANTPTFGATNTGFNAPSKSAGFGNSASPAFGATAAPSFGSTAPAAGFGSNAMSGFGTNTAASAFSKPQTTQNAFGSTSNAFGASNNFTAAQPQSSGFGATNPPTTQGGVFSFGSGAAPKPTGVFSFGAGSSGEGPKPSFNFSAGNTPAPAFGNSVTPAFGSTGAPSFGATVPLQFNAPQPAAPGMFSIGSGSSSGKARTHLKAKRRT